MKMVGEFIGFQKLLGLTGPSLSEKDCLVIFGISEANYKGWLQQQESRKVYEGQSLDESEIAWKEDQKRILEIIKAMNYVPGVKTMHLQFIRRYGNISVKRVRKLMRSMSLFATKRKRDAYKHQATHNHPFAAPAGNVVNREFYLGERRVVCGDITYVYYGPKRKLFYWCVFKDAFTTEVLGQAWGTTMDVELVKKAYDKMMSKHGAELKNALCCIHTDQGSQFCDFEYQDLLKKDGFIQSMSRRGASLDNCPIESFFGLSKTVLLDHLVLCDTLEKAGAMLDDYVDKYNNEYPQMDLGGLCPSEFYDYLITGVYPLESYFGVNAKDLLPLKELSNIRRRFADAEATKRRKEYADKKLGAAKAAPMGTVNPKERVKKDRDLVKKLLNRTLKRIEKAQKEEEKYEVTSMLIDVAIRFIENAPAKVLVDLTNVEHWKNYPELSYIYAMDGMF